MAIFLLVEKAVVWKSAVVPRARIEVFGAAYQPAGRS
jgi:hypothetical protein